MEASVSLKSNVPEYTVSELSGSLKRTVEEAFSYVRVRGEISGFKRAASGHLYFSLKDEKAVLASVCWRGVSDKIPFVIEDGLEVICSGSLTTFAGQSKYQLVVETIEPAGIGALMALFEKRKKQLAAEGLFADERKKPLPKFPKVIGVITSPSGAVIHDIIHRVRDRFPVHILLWPVAVQGEACATQVSAAIAGFNRLSSQGAVPRPDVLIVARGGGSLEDLWGYNEEIVVRAAAHSAIPIISAVGHETDVTLIDYAADRRAPTPTAAAEMAVPVAELLGNDVRLLGQRCDQTMNRMVEKYEAHIVSLYRALKTPHEVLNQWHKHLEYTGFRLQAFPERIERLALHVKSLGHKLKHPAAIMDAAVQSVRYTHQMAQKALKNTLIRAHDQWQFTARRLRLQPIITSQTQQKQKYQATLQRFKRIIAQQLCQWDEKLVVQKQLLDSYHYKKVLARGFAIVRTQEGEIIRSKAAVQPAMPMEIELHDGTIHAQVNDGAAPPRVRTQAKSLKPHPAQETPF